MRKRILLSFGFLLVAFSALTFLTNTNNNTITKNPNTPHSNDTAVLANTLTQTDSTTLKQNDTLTDIANFIAGIKMFKTSLLESLTKDSTWLKYADKTDKTWEKLDTTRYAQMKNWVNNQLANVPKHNYNLFYPFSGPDFLNADIFFPGADTISMFGLEPVGTLPQVEKKWFKDSLYKYVSTVKLALSDVLNLSFFRTKDMFKELRSSELNGAVHLLLWFAARRNYAIQHVKYVALAFNGNVIQKSSSDTNFTKSPIKGIEIACIQNNTLKVIRYFSADISNLGFKKNHCLNAFLQDYAFSNTLVKSASYLMHAANFTKIRDLILQKTTNLLQDDTGIPYRYLTNTNWNLTLFGTYEKPIHLFARNYQDDLRKAYDSLEVKPLTFGIGYKYRKNESTWMLITRKQNTDAELTAKQ